MIGICWARNICLCSSCEESLRIGGLRFIYLFHKWEDDFELPPFNSTRMVLVDCCQLMRQSGCATAIGFVGIVFVIPDRNFDLWFSVMCLQNLHKYTLVLGKATRNPLFTPRRTCDTSTTDRPARNSCETSSTFRDYSEAPSCWLLYLGEQQSLAGFLPFTTWVCELGSVSLISQVASLFLYMLIHILCTDKFQQFSVCSHRWLLTNCAKMD
jgi:hypothetical protein